MFFKLFTRDEIVFWIQKNLKVILGFFLVLTLSAVAFLTWHWWSYNQEYKAQVSLYKLQKALKLVAKEDDSKKPFNFLQGGEPEKELIFTEEIQKKTKDYEETVKQHQNFQTSVMFAIDLADFYYRYGQKEKAIELLSLFADSSKKHTLYHLAVFQLASYYMNENKCEKALPLYSDLFANKEAVAFHLESRLQKAICLEAMGRYKSALEEYEKINLEKSEEYIGKLAQDYKRMLILKKKLEE